MPGGGMSPEYIRHKWYHECARAKYMGMVDNATAEHPLVAIDFGSQSHLPKTTDGEAYYLHQLTIQHLGVVFFPTNRVTIHSYPETCGGKGTDEVCTALYHAAEALPDAKSLKIISDSTGAQNRSQFNVYAALAFVSSVFRFMPSMLQHFNGGLLRFITNAVSSLICLPPIVF